MPDVDCVSIRAEYNGKPAVCYTVRETMQELTQNLARNVSMSRVHAHLQNAASEFINRGRHVNKTTIEWGTWRVVRIDGTTYDRPQITIWVY